MADRTVVLDFELDVQEAVESINTLTEANKKLRKERNELNLKTAEGKKRAEEINAAIDQNTKKIKENVSAIEKQKINIGNYKSALDGVHPALGKVAGGLEKGTEGFKAMTLQALRFIATPVGAILAALVAVFLLLKSAISSNNQVLDKFENITNAIGVVMNVLIQRAGLLGEALIAFATGDLPGAIAKTKAAFDDLGGAIKAATIQGQLYLDLSRELEDSQRALRIESSKQENEIRRLVVASKNRNLTLDEQEALLRQALALEEKLVEKRADNAFKDLVLTAKQIALKKGLQQTEEETFDQFVNRLLTQGVIADEEADKIADKIEALESARGSSLAFQEKLENNLAAIQEKRTEAINKQSEALKEQIAQERALKRVQSGGQTGGLSSEIALINAKADLQIDAELHKAQTITGINERMAKDLEKINKKQAKSDAEIYDKNLEIYEAAELAKLDITADVLGSVASLTREGSTEYKVISSLQALISTYTGAQKSYEALSSIPYVGPALGTAAAAAAVVAGLARVAQINGIQFAEGGWTGPGQKWDVAGVVHADEYVVPKRVVNSPAASYHVEALERMRLAPYADGGMVTRTISNPINQSLELANAFKNIGPIYASWKEFSTVDRRMKAKQNISKI